MARSLLREGQLRDSDVLTESEHDSWVHKNLVTSGTLNFQDGTISGTGSIYADAYFGDGSGITGIIADSPNSIAQGNSYVEVTDAGTGQITADVDGVNTINLTSTSQRIGINTDSRIEINQSTDMLDAYAGNSKMLALSSIGARLGLTSDSLYIASTTNKIYGYSNTTKVLELGYLNTQLGDSDTLVDLYLSTDTLRLQAGGTVGAEIKSDTQYLGVSDDTNIFIQQSANTITFESNNTTEATINTSGLTLKSGTSVNEFSIDGTLAGNSDDAVPTEKAVKTYTDTNFFKDYQSNHVLNNLYLTDDIYIYKNTPSGISIRVGESGSYKYMSFDPDGILKVSSSTVWHAGNDGAGTGLDADLLDGIQASSFLRSDAADTMTGDLTLNAQLKFEGGDHAINYNDGGGNFNIRVGNYYSGGHKYSDNGSGAFHVEFAHESSNPTLNFKISEDPTLVLAGDDITWANTFTLKSDGTITWGGNKVFHAGNDGSSSGLDADTLDTYHATSFQRPALTTTGGLAVQATDDWNNYKTTGFYRAASLSNETPYKAQIWQYTIVVQHNADYVVQLAKGYNSADPWSYRTLYNTVWSDWNKIYSDADIEFSTDTTLSGNSDSAVPTEKAVKTYVDTELAGISSNAISQGNSDVTVTDAGTGEITADVDGEERLSLTKTEQVLGHPSGGSYTTTYWRSFSNSPTFGILNAVAEGEEVLNLTGGIQIFGISTDTNMSLTQSSNTITFEANNTTEATINTNGLTLKSGASVNEFSTDGTLAGNSDDAVPTEKAVKTYVDTLGTGKNTLINGNFDIWQRGTSFTTGYTADRWNIGLTGETGTVSRQTFTPGQADVPGNPKYYLRAAITTGGAAATALAILTEYIEGVEKHSGETVTISFYAKASSGTPDIVTELVQYFGASGSDNVYTYCDAHTLSTSWQKFTVTVDVPSISGKTIGSADDALVFVFWFSAGSNYAARTGSLGQQSITCDIARVQLEKGSVATEFEQRTFAEELVLCQRYFQKSFGLATTPADDVFSVQYPGMVYATDNCQAWVPFVVRMREAPTITLYGDSGNSSRWDYYSGGWQNATGQTTTGIREIGFNLNVVGTMTANNASLVRGDWIASAEF